MGENASDETGLRAMLPPALAEVRVYLAAHGSADAESVVRHLRESGYVLPIERLASTLARHPETFELTPGGGIALTGFEAADDPEHGPSSSDDADESWWTRPADPRRERVQPSDVLVIDVETTGLDADSDHIREIAAVGLDGDVRFVLDVDFPGREDDAECVTVVEAISRLRACIEPVRAIAGHRVAQFDIPFIQAVAKRHDTTWDVERPCIDLHELSLLVEPSITGRSLSELCAHLGVPLDRAHVAEDDARATAGALVALLDRVDPDDPNWALTIRVLEEAASPLSLVLPEARPIANLEGAFTRPPDPLASMPVCPPVAASAEAATDLTFSELGAMSGHHERRPQRQMACEVAKSLAGGRGLAVEAPTGTGKSLAYLVAASEWSARTGRPAVVATHTKVLQRQLRSDAQRLADLGLLRVPFRQLYGISNYVCVREIVETLKSPDLVGTEWLAIAVAIRAVAVTTSGVWDDVTDGLRTRTDLGYAQARATMRATSNTCEKSQCEHAAQCPAYQQKGRVRKGGAGILSVNHALVATWVEIDRSGGAAPGSPFGDDSGEEGSSALPPPGAIVFDEAHTLEDSLTSAWTRSTGAFDLRVLVGSVFGRHGPSRLASTAARQTGSGADEAAELRRQRKHVEFAIESLNEAAASYLHEFGGSGRQVELRWSTVRARPEYRRLANEARAADAVLGRLQAALIDVSHQVSAGDDGAVAPAVVRRARFRIDAAVTEIAGRRELLRELADLHDQHLQVDVLGVTASDVDRDGFADVWQFSRIPIYIGERFAHDVVDRLSATVLTSATLRVAGEFDFLERRLGIDIGDGAAFEQLVVDSPFDYDKQSAVIRTSHLPLPVPGAEQEFCEDLAADQVGLLSLTRGRMLTLFAARTRMEQVAELVRRHEYELSERGVQLLVQGEDTLGQITAQFRENKGTVLYGLRSFWEGFDAPGETLSFLVIEKPPYPHPGDPVSAARQRAIADAGGDPFMEYVVPQTAIALAQGFGRLIRREDDRGVALLCDRRLLNPTQANHVLIDTLPTNNVLDATDRDEAWTQAIEFVDGESPDLARAIVVDGGGVTALLDELRLVPGEDPTPKLTAAAAQLFGIHALRAEQLELMLAILAGRDVLGFLPTGFGKSLCFQLPALLHADARPTVVVSPLVALIKDQVDDLRARRGLRVVRGITGRTSAAERDDTIRELHDGKVRLVYLSPERLVRDGTLSTALATVQLNALIVDEAHCVSSWGHDFRPEFRQVVKPVLNFERSARVGLTATATPAVEQDLKETMDLREPVVVRAPVDRPDIRYWVRWVHDERDRSRELLRFVLHQGSRPGIVYASRRALTEEVAWLLRQAGVTARSYHAGMVPEQREAAQDDFLSGTNQVIVATKAFGMGVNKPDIGWVVHFDLPDSLEGYAQEAGRAARSPDIEGDALLLVSKGDVVRRKKLAGRSKLDRDGIASRVLGLIAEAPTRLDHHVFNAEELADAAELQVDELNVVVSWLERIGAVERDQDCTIRGTVGLGRREPPDPEERSKFFRVLHDRLGARLGRERRIVLDDLAQDLAMTADELERQLTTWSLQRYINYRSTARAWRVRVVTRKLDTNALERIVRQWQDLERGRVRQIESYASAERCRRTTIATTFGDPPVDCQRSGGHACDVCSGGEPYWYDVPASAVPDPESMLDLELIVLQAVRWSTWGIAQGRTQRYSETNLKHAVTGTEIIGTRPLPNRLLSCPQFGAGRYLRGKDRRVGAAVASLVDAGLVQRVSVEYQGRSYPSLELTDRGHTRLGGARG